MALPQFRRGRLPIVVLTAALLVLTMISPARADVVRHPDLKVTKGSVTLSPTGQRVTGRFTVLNAGSLPARASTSYVQARVAGKWRYVTELRILSLAPGKKGKYDFNSKAPGFLQQGSHAVRVCLDVKKKVDESRERNNCFILGKAELVHGPLNYQPDQKFFHAYDGGGYYGWVPEGYDDTHATPSALFVWLHGCGGRNEFDIESFHAPPSDDYITIAPSGREGDCWNTPADAQGDERLVLAAAREAAEHFNIDEGRLVVGGYSSGGDLAYRFGYLYSTIIDAVLAANSAPFMDTGFATPQQAMDTAQSEFRVVHLAHTGDLTYPIATVRSELQVLRDNLFPVTAVELPGTHYDEPGPGVPGTDADIQTHLLPQVDP
jgi:hypothetical protein